MRKALVENRAVWKQLEKEKLSGPVQRRKTAKMTVGEKTQWLRREWKKILQIQTQSSTFVHSLQRSTVAFGPSTSSNSFGYGVEISAFSLNRCHYYPKLRVQGRIVKSFVDDWFNQRYMDVFQHSVDTALEFMQNSSRIRRLLRTNSDWIGQHSDWKLQAVCEVLNSFVDVGSIPGERLLNLLKDKGLINDDEIVNAKTVFKKFREIIKQVRDQYQQKSRERRFLGKLFNHLVRREGARCAINIIQGSLAREVIARVEQSPITGPLM